LASFDKAVAIKPDYAVALANRGNMLLELRRSEDALASYDKALAITPNSALALTNRGNML
jgi:protein O-GlcNAc transferase